MDTEKKLGIKKSKAILLFMQMILIIILLATSIYLLAFVIKYNLGAWMLTSYIFITISVLAIIAYAVVGYKKGDIIYQISIIPFLVAIFVNILLPNRNAFQVAVLVILFTLTFAFLLRQKDQRFSNIIALLMVISSLTFSIYSSITADTQFLGSITTKWTTYAAMYLSIFIPVVMSGTIALTYNVRKSKGQ